MTSEENKQLIEKLINEAVNNKKFSLLDEIIDPNFVCHGIHSSQRAPGCFKEILIQFNRVFPDFQAKIEQIIAEDDLVATIGYWTDTNDPFIGLVSSEKHVCVPYSDFWRVKNGKCVENWTQMDMVSILQQIDAPPLELEYV